MNVDSFLNFLSNSSAAFIGFGLIIIVLGLTGGDARYGITVGSEFQWVALLIGVLLIAKGVVSENSESKTSPLKLIKMDYGVVLSLPSNDSAGRLPFILRGTFKSVPPASIKVWLFTESERLGDHYWPQGEVVISGKTWTYTIRDKKVINGLTLRCRLYLMTEDGLSFVKLYFHMNERRGDGDWRSIRTLPGCILPCSELMTFDFSGDPALGNRVKLA